MNTPNRLLLAILSACLFSGQGLLAQAAILSPDAFLPHRLGEQFTPHHLQVDYLAYLAQQAPNVMRLQRYGATHEARPMQIALFSAPENIARLEQIRENNQRLALLAPDAKAGSVQNMPVIVWLNMSIHGNEPSGAEAAMQLAWELATQTDPRVREWLKNTVVIIDPAANPDGYDRYTHWYRGVAHTIKNPNHYTREHQEPWPGGRPNHYYFDLNRDWAWATQSETRQRLAVFHQWLPHVLADVHEQFIDDHYYFAPAAEPMHAYLTPWQRQFQEEIGAHHARYFDEKGWLYFTNEVFDLLYPSYGDTYPMFNGSIGMTYEQAGHGKAGRAIKTSNGDTLTLSERIEHHLTTCRSTVEVASKNAQKVVEQFRDYYYRSSTQPPGQFGAYILRASNDPNRLHTFLQLLDRHHIRYGRAGVSLSAVKGFDYFSGKETTAAVQPNDIIVSAYQPKAVLVQVLFEPNAYVSDSLTYDITAWSLPFAHGIDAFAARQRIEPQKSYRAPSFSEVTPIAPLYAWCIHRKSLSDCAFVAALLEKGVKIRYATELFELGDQRFEPGAFVINRADNRHSEVELDRLVKSVAAQYNTALFPAYTGFNNKGSDFGSSKFRLINAPSIAMLYGEDVDENAYGHFWYFFEQELGYPINMIRADKIKSAALAGINTLIIPNGNYAFDEKTMTLLKEWVSEGGRIIAVEGGVKVFADQNGFELLSKPEAPKDTALAALKPYQLTERQLISEQLPGAIFKTQVDQTHPLAYGLGAHYFTLKTGSVAYQLNPKLQNAIWINDSLESYGFIGYKVKPRLKNTPVAAAQPMGNGTVIYLIDHPMFRSFWQAGKMIMANALFY